MRHLHAIRGHYYFRIRVPKDLQAIFCRGELKKALKTKDFKNARLLVKMLSHETDNFFTAIRCNVMTDDQIRKFLKEFIDTSLNGLEDARIDTPLNPEQHQQELERYNTIVHHLEHRLGTINTRSSDILLNELLKKEDIQVDKGSPEYRKLRVEFAKAEFEVNRIYRERLKGNYNNEYDKFLSSLVPKSHAPLKKSKLLSEVVAEYIKDKTVKKEWNEKNSAETITFYSQLIELMEDREIASYEKSDFIKLAEILTKFPKNLRKKQGLRDMQLPDIVSGIISGELKEYETISTTTVNKNFIRVNAVFHYAHKNGYIPVNYADGLRIKRKKKADEERERYSTEDLKTLFHSPVYSKVPVKRPERFWIPLIALHTGCRMGEICQLHKKDITVVDGIHCFAINEEGDKTIKTAESKRLVPISPVLIKLGFLRYVESVKHERLWSNLKKGRDGYGHLFNKWFSGYNRKHVTKNKKRVFHSLRHVFIDNLKQKKTIPETLVQELVGHAVDSMTYGRYGKDYSVKDKFDAIKKLNFGLDFSHLRFPFLR